MHSKTSDIAIPSGKKMNVGAHYSPSHSLRVSFNIRKNMTQELRRRKASIIIMLKSQKETGLINHVKRNNSGRLELNSKVPEITKLISSHT